jgi:hypothetical protein
MRFERFVVVGNKESGFNYREFTAKWGEAWIRDTLLVSRILAFPKPEGMVGNGVWTPFSHGLYVMNTTFVNYAEPGMAVVAACAWCNQAGSPGKFSGGFESRFVNITKVS